MSSAGIYNHPVRARADHLIQLGRASGFTSRQSMCSENDRNQDREGKRNQNLTWTKITYPPETRFLTDI
jgi:hypothetical protein